MVFPRTVPGVQAPLTVTAPGRVVAVAQDAGDLDEAAAALLGLTSIGHRVILVWAEGEPGPRLRSVKARVPVGVATGPHGPRARALRAGRTAAAVVLGDRGGLSARLRRDPRVRRTLASSDAVIALGDEARSISSELTDGRRPLLTPDELAQWELVPAIWEWLTRRGGVDTSRHDARDAPKLLSELQRLGLRVPTRHQAPLAPLVESLHGAGQYELAERLLGYLDEDAPVGHPADTALRKGLRVLVRTSVTGAEQPGVQGIIRELLAAADGALMDGDTGRAVTGATCALHLLFHRELHADGTSSPLVESPDAYLADWRSSRVGQLLAAPVPQQPPLPRSRERASGRARTDTRTGQPERRVVVVPGSYQQFAQPVIAALREQAEVAVARLSARPELRGLGPRKELVSARLHLGLGHPWTPDLEFLEQLETADALFVDWADRGSLAAAMSAPAGLPIILRIHSMDALSAWIHLLDWDRIGDLVLVSDHLRDLVVRVLGERLSGTRLHVVPNVVDTGRLTTDKTPGHRRRLLMVGWAQRVKDPLWALEVLARLRADDPSWRLSLVGADFVPGSVRSQQAYARDFWARLVRDDVRAGVDFVGYTRELAPHFAAAGFVISTSRRESFGLGLVEGAATGAVPVVRDWPMFASLEGARGLFPDDWVVETPEQAAARIRSLAGEHEWSRASREARATVQERFASDSSRSLIQELVLNRR